MIACLLVLCGSSVYVQKKSSCGASLLEAGSFCALSVVSLPRFVVCVGATVAVVTDAGILGGDVGKIWLRQQNESGVAAVWSGHSRCDFLAGLSLTEP